MTSSIYPTGTTIYYPDKCWNGYIVFPVKRDGATMVDMNGNVVNQWRGLYGFHNKLLPGGYIMGNTGERNPAHGFQDMIDVVQVDWEGKMNWFYRAYRIPYEWVPQMEKPEEKAIPQLDNSKFRVLGSLRRKPLKVTMVKSGRKTTFESQFCVLSRLVENNHQSILKR